MVDLPEPDEPTRAVTVPGSRQKADAVKHRLVGLVGEFDVLEFHRALDRRHLDDCGPGTWFSSSSAMISPVRSRPAKASVSCVPMFTIWKTGAIMKARNMLYWK